MTVNQRRVEFDHDGHHFESAERLSAAADGQHGDRRVTWVVRMDGAQVLEFEGGYPYRDEDVRKRILEWYAIQKPRPGAR